MKCPECTFENPEGFKFCPNCGQKLEALEKQGSINQVFKTEGEDEIIPLQTAVA